MAPSRPSPSFRAELAAALGVFALLLQALLPAAALAAQARGGGGGEPVAICSLAGAQTLAADPGARHGKGFAGLPCQDCLTCAIAALPTAEPQALSVRYAVRTTTTPRAHELGPRLARAPPRPPGQGPPQA